MIRRDRIPIAALATALLACLAAGCTAGGGKLVMGLAPVPTTGVPAPMAPATGGTATPLAGDDTALEAASLLIAAEQARSDAARAPMLARLDELGVQLAEGSGGDDPLDGWRQANKGPDDPPWHGRALGPAYRRARVAPGQSLVIEQIFLAGQQARIAAQTSTGASVALAISNPRAEPVCTRQLSPSASCTWMPAYTERFAIQLQNRGRVPVSVYLVVR